MLTIKLTCPSCGRSTEASERVVGKEVRCSCGTSFRVMGLKPSEPAAPQSRSQPAAPLSQAQPAAASSSRPQTRSRPVAPPSNPQQQEFRPRPAAAPSNRPQPPPPRAQEFDPPERYTLPGRPVPRRAPAARQGGTPPWAYGAIGGLGVMSLVLVIVLIRTMIPRPGPPSRGVDGERLVAARAEPSGDPDSSDLSRAHRASAGALSTAEIVARCEPSVALIKGKASIGTGFLVRRGVIATNAHVIEDEFVSSLEVRFPSAPEPKKGPMRQTPVRGSKARPGLPRHSE